MNREKRQYKAMLKIFSMLLFLCAAIWPALSHAQSADSYLSPFSEKQNRAAEMLLPRDISDESIAPLYLENDELYTKRQFRSPLNERTRFSNLNALKAAPIKPAPSVLEDMYSRRAGMAVEQFGYDLFGVPSLDTQQHMDEAQSAEESKRNNLPSGAVEDEFILGIKDEVEVVFTGQRSDRDIYKVNAQGFILINDFPPIPAAGRTMGQVRLSIDSAARMLHNTQAYISLHAVRQIGVLVVGHVKKPGKKTLTVFHTVLDALMESGGIEKTGSLRQIKIVRGGETRNLDLYDLLTGNGLKADLNLRDGDRIIVPAIGATLAVAGEVKRPGVFELPAAENNKLSLIEMLELSGGILAPGKNRFLKLEVTPDGREDLQNVTNDRAAIFGDGSILMISKGEEKRASTVRLSGHTRRPGLYALNENKTLSNLISSADILGKNIYPLIGVIQRWDEDQLAHSLIEFPLKQVLDKGYDRRLQDGDTIHLFSYAQILSLREPASGMETEGTRANGNAFASPNGNTSSVSPSLTDLRYVKYNQRSGSAENADDEIMNDSLRSFLTERSAFLRGAVRRPGPYPVADGTTLDTLLAVAGGLTLEANTGNIEITAASGTGTSRNQIDLSQTRARDITIQAGDAVRVNAQIKKYKEESVLIIGEIQSPGRYDLLPGDKLSDLVTRAGGLTRQAYPEGTIFSRESERLAEEARFKAQARSLKRAVAAALEIDDKKVDTGKISETRELARELEEAQGLGRITVEADPAMLNTNPDQDMPLQAGDRIYIPKRSLTVRVRGEVLSPANLQFTKDKKSLDYIHEAGGFTYHADKERTFVIYPDGSAQPIQVSSWNYKPVFIPPGSTIIVPRDPEPFDFVDSAKDLSQILSNLAITAIFIDDVAGDD